MKERILQLLTTEEKCNAFDSDCVKMSKVQKLRLLVEQRLTAAAEEIFVLFERTIAEYEEEVCRKKDENDKRQPRLDDVWIQKVPFHTADIHQLSEVKRELLPEQHIRSTSLDQEDPEPPHIKEEEEELWTNQEGDFQFERLRALVKQRLNSDAEEIFELFKSIIVEYKEEVRTKRENEQQQKLLDDDLNLKSKTGSPADVHQLSVVKVEVLPEQQVWSANLEQGDSEPLHVKEEQEELWTNQVFPSTCVPVKSEDDEEEAQSSQLHPRHTEDPAEETDDSEDWTDSEPESDLNKKTEVEADGEDCQRPEPDINRVHTKDLKSRAVQSRQSKRRRPFDKQSSLERHMEAHTGQRLVGSKRGATFCKTNMTQVSSTRDMMDNNVSCGSEVGEKRKRHPCSMCGKTFDRNSLLERHMRIHTGEKPYSCSVCQRRFRLKGHLYVHMPIHTGQKTESNNSTGSDAGRKRKTLPCSVCGKIFFFKSDLETHMRIHTGEKPFSCSICQKRFRLKGHLNIHMGTHARQRLVGSEFGATMDNNDSTGSDVGQKKNKLECSVCGKIFFFKSDLETHMRIHTGEKPFGCSVCQKRFRLKCNLTGHMATHTGEKPFYCEACGIRFTRKAGLRRHNEDNTGEKPFSCSVCKEEFSHRCTLRIHITTHIGEKQFGCSVCGKKFAQKSHLKTHIQVHTVDKPFSCSVCNKCFRHKCSFRRHLKIHKRQKTLSSHVDDAPGEVCTTMSSDPDKPEQADPDVQPEDSSHLNSEGE